MHFHRRLAAFLVLSIALVPSSSPAQTADAAAKDKIVAEATKGKLTAVKGKYFEKDCEASLDYEAEVIDLNADGQPEVFTSVQGACLGGAAGVHMDLYIKGSSGEWKAQFGFPGMHTVLKTTNKGYPDIEIGGPGACFPVWRWNEKEYALHKKCP